MESDLQERLRRLPGVDRVASCLDPVSLGVSSRIMTVVVRDVIALARDRLRKDPSGTGDLTAQGLAVEVEARLRTLAGLRPERVVNATGVLIHTNLGRSPLSTKAVEHLTRVAAGYSDLEFDLESGRRGSRHDHIEDLFRVLTGAEAALVVNNNAAAVLLSLATLARGKEVLISRGELVEIGGSFRIPDILAASGAVLREVGTTNRTHLDDYRKALGPETGMLLRVHASNYRIEGFTAEVSSPELVALGREAGVPVMVDLGSGALLDVAETGVRPEPLIEDVIAEGPDLVTFSGDKLLGGPQAGVILGKKDVVGRVRKHPLARAVRIDKLLLAALQATLVSYLDRDRARTEIPVLGMLFQDPDVVHSRAEKLAGALESTLPEPRPKVMVDTATAAVGGGTLPLEGLATSVVAIDPEPHTTAARLERALRHVRPALLGRIHENRVLLDLRTVAVDEEGQIPDLVSEAWSAAIKGA